jgi:hypothetical protein
MCDHCNQHILHNDGQPKLKQPIRNQQEHVISVQKPMTAQKPSPYESYKNYRVLKDFFSVQVIENQNTMNPLLHEPKTVHIRNT